MIIKKIMHGVSFLINVCVCLSVIAATNTTTKIMNDDAASQSEIVTLSLGFTREIFSQCKGWNWESQSVKKKSIEVGLVPFSEMNTDLRT